MVTVVKCTEKIVTTETGIQSRISQLLSGLYGPATGRCGLDSVTVATNYVVLARTSGGMKHSYRKSFHHTTVALHCEIINEIMYFQKWIVVNQSIWQNI